MRRGAVRGVRRAAATWAIRLLLPVALLIPAASARAHLALAATSLVGLVAASQGIVVARVRVATEASPTATARGAESPVAVTELDAVLPIAGAVPEGRFRISAPAPILRYAAGETALVLLDGPPPRAGETRVETPWRSKQVAGSGLGLPSSLPPEATGLDVKPTLATLWNATHGAHATDPDYQAVTAALVDALRLPIPKVRYLALLDLTSLAHHPEYFSRATRDSIAAYGRTPGADPALEALVASLGRALQSSARYDGGEAHDG